mmetsp:Transcript_19063/g.27620  ORF Transcript_19063/g.27620 Transcript_19063/m.27620 type:complete len:363 (+) Transcript_19063:103-1191(+)
MYRSPLARYVFRRADLAGKIGSGRRNFHRTGVALRTFRGGDGTISSSRSRKALPINLGIIVVPQQSNYIVERFGKFYRLLNPGIEFLIPLVDQIAYTHSLKEEALSIPNQTAVTRDNVTITIDGVLYVKVEDAYNASYGVEDPHLAMSLLAQTTMRSELGKLTLDKTFKERETLNELIVDRINKAAKPWGIRCIRYEIRDIHPAEGVRRAMELQAEAERRKRAQILDSEAEMQSDINVAQGHKTSMILTSEAEKVEKVNQGLGEANAILARMRAISESLDLISEAVNANEKGRQAVKLRVLEQYIHSFHEIARKTNSIVVPGGKGGSDMSSFVAQAITLATKLNEPVPDEGEGGEATETGRE